MTEVIENKQKKLKQINNPSAADKDKKKSTIDKEKSAAEGERRLSTTPMCEGKNGATSKEFGAAGSGACIVDEKLDEITVPTEKVKPVVPVAP